MLNSKEPKKTLRFRERFHLHLSFPIGCKVATKKGCRLRGVFEGRVKGYGVWKNYLAVNVKKIDGKVVQCLAKNLMRVK